jgi:hypothetical protein
MTLSTLQKLVLDLCRKKRMEIPELSLVEGPSMGILDVHLLQLTKNGTTVSTVIYLADLDDLHNGIRRQRLLATVLEAMSQLRQMTQRYKKRDPALNNR